MGLYDDIVQWGQDQIEFERFQLDKWKDMIKEDPERIFIGAMFAPGGEQVWGKALGKDYEPSVNLWGGPRGATFEEAEAEGIDTSASRGMHSLAEGIAKMYAFDWASGAIQGAGAEQGIDPDYIDKGIEFGKKLWDAQKASEETEEVVGEIPTQPIVGGGIDPLKAVSTFGEGPPEINTESGAPGTIAIPGAIPTFSAPIPSPPEQFGTLRG